MNRLIRVLVVDDSAVVRKILSENLNRVNDLEVVEAVSDPFIAREVLASKDIDVIILDLEMPRMDGLSFLKQLMRHFPLPVIILSSLVKEQADLVLHAYDAGAVDVLPKPGGPYSVTEVIQSLVQTIRSAARLKTSLQLKKLTRQKTGATRSISKTDLGSFATSNPIIAIGTSTGGTRALEYLFKDYPSNLPPTLCVIHMPQGFTASFAERLNGISKANIVEASDGMTAKIGHVYIAKGNQQMSVRRVGKNYHIRSRPGPKVNRHCPSVGVLFTSLLQAAPKSTVAAILTGMGNDGAVEMKDLKDAGAYTIAQDEESSIVFGMPKEAIDLGAARKISSLGSMTHSIIEGLKSLT